MDHIALAQQLRHLVIFKNLRTEPLVAALADALEKGDAASVCDLAAELYPRGMDLRQAMATLLLQDDNFCVREAAALRPLPRQAADWLERELALLEEAVSASAQLQSADLPAWELAGESLADTYKEMLRNAPCLGYGIFSQYHVFSVFPEKRKAPSFPSNIPTPSSSASCTVTKPSVRSCCRTPAHCCRVCPPTTSCSTAMPVPASPVPSRHWSMSIRIRACG